MIEHKWVAKATLTIACSVIKNEDGEFYVSTEPHVTVCIHKHIDYMTIVCDVCDQLVTVAFGSECPEIRIGSED